MENIWNAAGQDVEIPLTEPQRQYYFIDRAKKYLEKMSEAAGRPLTFCVTTFGCQMNARDSEKLTGILEQIGYLKKKRLTLSSIIRVRSVKMQTREYTDAWDSSAGSKRKIRT